MFIDTIRAVNNLRPTDRNRIEALCLTWVPTKLESGATRSVYENLPQATKNNWTTLRQALSKAFRDESEEINFLNNEGAWKRTPGMSLRDYRNGLIHRLDKYQANLRNVAQEWERSAVR